ncbi:MAG: CDC48 family AAA ATPase [Synergistaceae bacterium]|nr:CDC48 family AAA ATPase [Synergistaceae bacterium]
MQTHTLSNTFTVNEAYQGDALKGWARIHPDDMAELELSDGELIGITGRRITIARIRAGDRETGRGIIQIDGLIRENAGASLDDTITIEPKITHHFAGSVTLQPLGDVTLSSKEKDENYILSLLEGHAVVAGDRVRLNLFGTRVCDFQVTASTPDGVVIITRSTYLNLLKPSEAKHTHKVTYEDIGGLGPQIRRVREMIELPLRFPQVFERLGIQPPRGVLLYGPPGTGKTVIARAVANETDAWFTHISGPEIIGKFYGESEERLRNIFEEAQERAPSIIFIDEIDAIAPKREDMGGEKQVERRVVAQLLALMDGLKSRGQLIVIGATNIPNALDPALRRPGRFDREISIPVPDKNGRLEILKIHTRGMPLAQDVDLSRVADMSHGFVGADLEALAKEAAMSCVRDILPYVNLHEGEIPYERVASMEVTMKHFMNALLETDPSATREVSVEIPDVSWQDIGGLENIKDELVRAVTWPVKYADIFTKYDIQPARSILLYGASGTGKTLLAKALARESGVNFINVQSTNVLSRYLGESERALKDIFRVARQAAPSIIFFDGIEALFPDRSTSGMSMFASTESRLTAQFTAEMHGIEELNGVTVLAATNRPELLDKSLLFDLRLELPLPDKRTREEIFRILLRKKPLADDVNISELAVMTQNFTGGDISLICRRASMTALSRNPERLTIYRRDFMEVISNVRDQYID